MIRRAPRLFPGCLVAALLAACSSVPSRPPALEPPGAAGEHRLLVTFIAEALPAPRYAGSGRSAWPATPAYQARSVPRDLQARLEALGLETLALWPIAPLGVQCLVVAAASVEAAQLSLGALAREPAVESVQPLYWYDMLEGDPYLGAQANLHELGITQAHASATGRGVRIAIVDSLVDAAHEDLRDATLRVTDVTGRPGGPERHGTAVAGVIVAQPDNGVGIVGVAPDAELRAVRACWEPAGGQPAVCDGFSLLLAVDRALAAGADVLNLSLGGPEDPLLARLLTHAMQRGVVVVAAAGRAADGSEYFPASLPGVLAAGTGPTSIALPEVAILTTVPNGGYDFFGGSSLAAAQLSGLVALLLERRPGLSIRELRRHLASLPDTCAVLGGSDGGCPTVIATRAAH